MLFLVFADRHMGCLIEQNIGGHKIGIDVKPDRGFFAVFAGFFLKLRHPIEPAHARHAIQHPSQFGMVRHLGLVKDNMVFRVDPGGNKSGRHFTRIGGQFLRVLKHGNGVQIDHAIKTFMAVLQGDKIANGAQIIAEMQIAGRLYAGQDTQGRVAHHKSFLLTPPVDSTTKAVKARLWRITGCPARGRYRRAAIRPKQ